MIEWYDIVSGAAVVVGLALSLAALSVAAYAGRHSGRGVRHELGGTRFQLLFNLGLALFCCGLLLPVQEWWGRLMWAGLAALFLGFAVGTWRASRTEPFRTRRERRAGTPRRTGGKPQSPATPDHEASRMGSDLRTYPSGGMRRRVRDKRLLGWGLVAAGMLLALGWVLVTGSGLLAHVRSAETHLQQLEVLLKSDVSSADVSGLATQAGAHLSALRADLGAIQAQAGPLLPAGRLLQWVPRYGADAAAASDLLLAALSVTTAGDRLFQSLSPMLATLAEAGKDPHSRLLLGEHLLPGLVAAQPELNAARVELEVARGAKGQIDSSALSPRVEGWVRRLDQALPLLDAMANGGLAAPWLLGADSPRTFLLLAQNNDELRPTGGFISGVGELRVERGRLTALAFDDSYAVDNLEVDHDLTPSDFRQTLFGELWFFRDSNWDADFPASAQRALDIYARDRGVVADGVVTLDLFALQLLVAAIGPIPVEGLNAPVTGENVAQVVRDAWSQLAVRQGDAWWLHRKDFMGQIAAAALVRAMAGDQVQPAKVLSAVGRALDEKHVLVFLREPHATRAAQQLGWDGAVSMLSSGAKAAVGDRLLVVDTNVGFNKVDPKVERSLHYQVDLGAEGGPISQLAVTYVNRSNRAVDICVQESRYGDTYADMMDRCYWDYLRVYVPAGSRLLTGPDLSWPTGSLWAQADLEPPGALAASSVPPGYEVWTAFWDLPPGVSRTLVFEYQLPTAVLEHLQDGAVRYRLKVVKQPGTHAVPLQLDVAFPVGWELDTDRVRGQSGAATWPHAEVQLRTDQEYEMVFVPSGR